MATPAPAESTGRGMRALTLATVFAAASGYLVMIVAARALGAAGAADFSAYWGLFFALGGVANGLTQESTRAVRAARHPSDDGAPVSATLPAVAAGRPVRVRRADDAMNTPDSIAGRADGSKAEGNIYPEKRALSLRGRLIGLLLAAVAAVAALQALVIWRTALSETEAVFDAQMEGIALSLTGGLAASLLGDDERGTGRTTSPTR